MAVKPKRTVVPTPPQPPTENISEFAPPMERPLTSIVIAEPPTRPKRKAATKSSEAHQPIQKRKRSSPSITDSEESLASTQTCPPTTSSSSAPSRQKRRQLIKTNANPNQVNCLYNSENCGQKSEFRVRLYSRPLFSSANIPDPILYFAEL